MDITQLLTFAHSEGASDLHLSAGEPPMVRIHGDVKRIEHPPLSAEEVHTMLYDIMSDQIRKTYEAINDADFSFELGDIARFRVNVFRTRRGEGAVFRTIPAKVVTLDDLGMPPIMKELCDKEKGLILVTGPTGSGKSTTLAAMINHINDSFEGHILTIEDPIEYMHRHKVAVVNQREVGSDTLSFAEALKHALRQDPDVILVGELRDLETMSTALTAAETGHLVFATLHTQDAPGTIQRVIDVFPSHQQQQVRVQLAGSLQGVVCQQLLPALTGKGRVAAVEVLVATPAVRNLIREGKVHQIRTAMQAGGKYGMHTMEQSLAQLVRAGQISAAAAMERAANAEELLDLLGRGRQ